MTTSIIEQLDKSRHNLLKWFTVSWAIWFGAYIIKDHISSNLIIGIIIIAGLLGWVLWVVNLVRLKKLGKIISADNHLKNAMNDELFEHNKNKSIAVGFWAFIISVCAFLVVSLYSDISALVVSEVTLYIGILSSLIASLIYNKG